MKAGTIFVTSSGEYSDFGINGFWRALTDFDIDKCVKTYVNMGVAAFETEKQPWESRFRFEPSEFMQALLDQKLIEEVSIPQFHLGDYGDVPSSPLEPYNGTQPTETVATWVRACCSHEDCRNYPEIGVMCSRTSHPISDDHGRKTP